MKVLGLKEKEIFVQFKDSVQKWNLTDVKYLGSTMNMHRYRFFFEPIKEVI